MKYLLLILVLFFSLSGFAQEKKIISISKQEILKAPRIDSSFPILNLGPYDNGKLKIKVIIESDNIYKDILKNNTLYSYQNQGIKISENGYLETDSIGKDLSFIIEKEFNKSVLLFIHYRYDTRSFIIDSNLESININYTPQCENIKQVVLFKCPKCNKNNRLQKIVYGFGGSKNRNEYDGGCVVDSCPNYLYCKRCKLEF